MGDCNRDSRGRPIRGRKQRRLRRQQRCQRRAASDASSDSLRIGLQEIARVSARLDLGDRVQETASVIYRQAVDERLLYGRPCESVAAASVYLAVRTADVLRSLAEVVTASPSPRRRVARESRHLQRELDIAVEPPAVVEYLPRIRSDLGLSERAGRWARQLLGAAIEANLHSGRDPNGLAASVLYTITLLDDRCPDRCQTAVGEVADVSPATIRERHRELRPLCPEVFDIDTAEIPSPSTRSGKRPDAWPAHEPRIAD